MSPNIVLFPTHGLANRLRALASAHILAEYVGSQLFMRWLPEDCCNCTYEDLFALPRIPEITQPPREPVMYVPNTHTSTLLSTNENDFDNAGTLLIRGGHEFKHPRMSEATFLERKRAFYASLRPIAAIEAMAEDTVQDTAEDTVQDTVAVHFRDFVPQFDQADGRVFNEVSPLKDFVELCKFISAQRPDIRYAIFTNTAFARNALAEALPTALPVSDDDVYDRDSKEGVRRALADMLAMSRCRMIIGTDMSSFSDEACFFRGTPKMCITTQSDHSYHCHGTSRYLGQRFVMFDHDRVTSVFRPSSAV